MEGGLGRLWSPLYAGLVLCVAINGTVAAQPASDEDTERDRAISLKPITVEVTRIQQRRLETAAPVSVITRKDLRQRQARDLSDILQGIPGVVAEGGGRGLAMQPNIRGLGESRVVTRINGARQNLHKSHVGRGFIAPALIERVEILRGPASTLYGSGALGGVVSIETIDAPTFLNGDPWGFRITSAYETNGDLTAGSALIAGQIGPVGALFGIVSRESDDYEDGDGEVVPFTRTDTVSGLVSLSWQTGAIGYFEFNSLYFGSEHLGLLTPNLASTQELVFRDTEKTTTSLTWRYQGPSNPWVDAEVTAYRNEITLQTKDVDTGVKGEDVLETIGLDLANTSRFTTAGIGHILTYGVEIFRDSQQSTQGGQPEPGFADSQRLSMGAFVRNQFLIGTKWVVSLGLRYDHIEMEAERAGLESSVFSELSSQVSVSYHFTRALMGYVSYAQAFRAPSLRALFVGGVHFPGNTYIPNPNLQPETAENKEIGLSYARTGVFAPTDRLTVRAAAFQNDLEDYIEEVVLANHTVFRNVGKARIRGLELSIRYSRLNNWYVSAAGTMLRGENLVKDEPLQSIPADRLTLTGGKLWWDGALSTGVQLTLVAEQDDVPYEPFTIAPTPSHEQLDLFATWYGPKENGIRITLAIDNVTDSTYRWHLSQINQPGRNIKLSVSYRPRL